MFNVGADQLCSLNELAGLVSAAMEVPPDVVHLAPRREVQHVHADHGLVRRVFGIRTVTPLGTGSRTPRPGLASMARARHRASTGSKLQEIFRTRGAIDGRRRDQAGHASCARRDSPVATDVNSAPPVILSIPNRSTKMFRTAGTNDDPPVRNT